MPGMKRKSTTSTVKDSDDGDPERPKLARVPTVRIEPGEEDASADPPLKKQKDDNPKRRLNLPFFSRSTSVVEAGNMLTTVNCLPSGSSIGRTTSRIPSPPLPKPSHLQTKTSFFSETNKTKSRKERTVMFSDDIEEAYLTHTSDDSGPLTQTLSSSSSSPLSETLSSSTDFEKFDSSFSKSEMEVADAVASLKKSTSGSSVSSCTSSASTLSRSQTLPPGGLMEIVFSFDTTGSMYSCLDEVRECIQDMVQRLQSDIPGIRIAVIAHGDYCDWDSYILKWIDFGASVSELCEFVKNVDRTGGGDFEECYELVLRRCRTVLSWTPGSQRTLVMVGDSTPHDVDYRCEGFINDLDWREEAEALREMGVRIYGVQCPGIHPMKLATRDFYREMSSMTGGCHLKLDQFINIFDLVIAICYKEGKPELLQAFETEVRSKQIYTESNIQKDLDDIFRALREKREDTLPGGIIRRKTTRVPATPGARTSPRKSALKSPDTGKEKPSLGETPQGLKRKAAVLTRAKSLDGTVSAGPSGSKPSMLRAPTIVVTGPEEAESGEVQTKKQKLSLECLSGQPFFRRSRSIVETGNLLTMVEGLLSGSYTGKTITISPSLQTPLLFQTPMEEKSVFSESFAERLIKTKEDKTVVLTDKVEMEKYPSLAKFAFSTDPLPSTGSEFNLFQKATSIAESEVEAALTTLMKSSSTSADSNCTTSSLCRDPTLPPGGLMEVVFSFDTTGSMYSCLDEVRERIQDMVLRLQADIPGIRIAVIAHGDYCDWDSYVVKWIDFGASVSELCDFVKNVDRTGGGDFEECYELVLHRCRTVMSWTPGSQRTLVLVGDSTPHDVDYKYEGTVNDIDWIKEVEELRDMGVRIYGVQCPGIHPQRIATREFFQRLTAMTGGSHLKLDQFTNIFDLVMAICYKEGRPELLSAYESEVRTKHSGMLHKDLESIFRKLREDREDSLPGGIVRRKTTRLPVPAGASKRRSTSQTDNAEHTPSTASPSTHQLGVPSQTPKDTVSIGPGDVVASTTEMSQVKIRNKRLVVPSVKGDVHRASLATAKAKKSQRNRRELKPEKPCSGTSDRAGRLPRGSKEITNKVNAIGSKNKPKVSKTSASSKANNSETVDKVEIKMKTMGKQSVKTDISRYPRSSNRTRRGKEASTMLDDANIDAKSRRVALSRNRGAQATTVTPQRKSAKRNTTMSETKQNTKERIATKGDTRADAQKSTQINEIQTRTRGSKSVAKTSSTGSTTRFSKNKKLKSFSPSKSSTRPAAKKSSVAKLPSVIISKDSGIKTKPLSTKAKTQKAKAAKNRKNQSQAAKAVMTVEIKGGKVSKNVPSVTTRKSKQQKNVNSVKRTGQNGNLAMNNSRTRSRASRRK